MNLKSAGGVVGKKGRSLFIVRANVVSNHSSAPEERSRGTCREGVRAHGLRTYRDIRRGFERNGGVLQIRRAYLAGRGVELVEVYWFPRDVGAQFHSQEAGPASLGTSVANQRRHILLGVENHHSVMEVGHLDRPANWARRWTPESCAGLGDVDDD